MVTRQVDFDRRAFANLTVYLDMTARLLHEAIDLRKTEACSLSDVFGRKKRIEGFGFHLGRHADSVVSHREHDILPRQHLHPLRGIAFIEMHVRCLESQLPSCRHCVAGVYRQIDDRHFQLVGIRMGAP